MVPACDHEGVPMQRYQCAWLRRTWVAVFGLVPANTGAAGAVYAGGLITGWGHRNLVAVCCWLVWASIGVVASVRSALVAVVVTPQRLIIRNFFTTRRIAWSDIQAIGRPRPFIHAGQWSGLYNTGNGLRVQLTDGRVRVATAYSPAGWDPPEFADAVIEELHRYLPQRGRRPVRLGLGRQAVAGT
jgi:hypothetical protein